MSTFFIACASFSLATTLMFAAGVQDGWRNLKEVTRDRVYTVIFRDGHCAQGSIVSVNDQSVVFDAEAGKDHVIKRADVIRISDTPLSLAYDAIFSGRSSWIDVKAADPGGAEYLDIVTKSGEEWKWKQPTVTDDSIVFVGQTVAKTNIRFVSYVRFKPLTRREEYVHHENVDLLAPRLWFNYLMLGKISVLLYNSELAEDNSPAGCQQK